MRRIISVWLPRFPTDRIERKRAASPLQSEAKPPLAIVAEGCDGHRLLAVNAAAEAAGLRSGMLLTDALAIFPDLLAARQSERSETKELERLAVWCRRYAPYAAVDGPDGLLLDITDCAHLFGGEAALLGDMMKRLDRFGFAARAAAAGTVGAAWALARFGAIAAIAATGDEMTALSSLPVEALRLEKETVDQLERCGLRTIGQLAGMPRESLRARFGEEVGRRLDQALGREGKMISPAMPATLYAATANFPDPITQFESIQQAAQALIARVASELQSHGKGARRFVLRLFDNRGGVVEVIVLTMKARAELKHIDGLFRERLQGLDGRLDGTVGFETITLEATRAEPLKRAQQLLQGVTGEEGAPRQDLHALLNRLSARLGSEAVMRLPFQEGYAHERACISAPASHAGGAKRALRPTAPQPIMLLARAEPIAVVAALPDYPPRRFTWRGIKHRVVKAEGPERMTPEWRLASDDGAQPRDYYAVEDETGARFWLYREGFYGQSHQAPRWFVQGLFA